MAKIERVPGVTYQVLVPNMKGLQRALPIKPDGVHLMMSVTECHNRANANRSIDESLKEFEQMVPAALEAGVRPEAGMAVRLRLPLRG